MTGFLQFALLGLGAGAVYTLLAQGVVLVYKGSGVVNFAQGAFGMFAALMFYDLRDNHHWSTALAAVVAILSVVALGVCFSQLVMRRLQVKSRLAQVVATLAAITVLQGAAQQIWGPNPQLVITPLPHSPVRVGSVVFPQDRIWLFGLAVLLTAILWAVFRFTLIGHATMAMAENTQATASLGWSPNFLSGLTWGIGAGLAAIGGILIAPLAGLDTTTLTLIVIDALAVVLAAGFQSFPLVLLVGCGLGVVQSEAVKFGHIAGLGEAVSLVVIVIVLVIRGQNLPVRGHILERLPALGTGKISIRKLVFWTGIVVVAELFLFPASWVAGITISITTAIILLSVVVLTGYAGQLSLAQYSLGGVGALIAGLLVADYHWPFEIAIVGGVAATMVVGLVFALPALRTRGITLAIVTFALALAIENVVFDSSANVNVGPQHFFGINVDSVFQAPSYAVLCTLFFVLLALVVSNLRRSRAGRRLIAIRSNERAAAALGIGVVGGKMYAFALAAGIAAVGGILAAFSSYVIVPLNFSSLQSVVVIVYSVLGGVGYVVGAILGGQFAPNGITASVLQDVPGLSFIANNIAFFAGVGLILILLQNPDGMASRLTKREGADPLQRFVIRHMKGLLSRLRDASRSREPLRKRKAVAAPAPQTLFSGLTLQVERVTPAVLSATGITVKFGGHRAVSDASVRVETGEVVGLIGPNGAGKTTFLDVISGFTKPDSGHILLNEETIDHWAVHRRARSGIGRSFQSLELFEDVSLRENLLAACEDRDLLAYCKGLVRPGSPALTPAAAFAVRDFGLQDDLEVNPNQLSNGRRHLVSIARAAAGGPSILLLDEPVAGLDEHESLELGHLIRTLSEEWGMGLLVVEHNMDFVMGVCDRVVVLEFGKVIAEGTPAEIRVDPAVITAYLGEALEVQT